VNIVFLDIDGVLQPYSSENNFYEINNKTKKLVENLSQKYKIDYSKYNIYDILMTYYDWDESAVARLKYILDETSSKIIVSSNWRSEKNIYKMRDLLTIRSLGDYWFADNSILNYKLTFGEKRALEIKKSLFKYPIDNFVILDDLKELKDFFPNNAVITFDYLKNKDVDECIKILKK